MRVFLRPTGIDRLSLEARLVYTGFCLLVLVGYGSSLWLYLDAGLGLGGAGAESWYSGDAASAPPATAGGPAIDLPEEARAPLRLPKPPRQVIETLHFHALSMPVVLLILAHLFMMCSLNSAIKSTIIVVAHVGTLAHLVTPPLVRFVSPAWSWMMGPSAVVMAVTWLVLTLWPAVEMWLAPRPPDLQ